MTIAARVRAHLHDADDALWMAYHAWTPGFAGYSGGGTRALCMTRVGFVDGRPVVQPSPTSS